jgi:hypothetical protein
MVNELLIHFYNRYSRAAYILNKYPLSLSFWMGFMPNFLYISKAKTKPFEIKFCKSAELTKL